MGGVIFLSGPIGAGKTTLGQAIAARLGAVFLDGDDFAEHTKPWFASSLKTSRGIADAALAALADRELVVAAYPLRRINYVYFYRRLSDAGYSLMVVTLRASLEATVDPGRARRFSAGEVERIGEMIAQGYGDRPFSDLIVDTDAAGFEATAEALVQRLKMRLRPYQ